jgi:serine/threonine-protein phosphatase 2B catalytic subunit
MSTCSSINYQRDFWYKWLVIINIDGLILFICFLQDKPNLPLLLQHLEAEGRLELDAALTIMIRGRELTAREPNMIEISTPVTIVGDIHGQFFDMVFISVFT